MSEIGEKVDNLLEITVDAVFNELSSRISSAKQFAVRNSLFQGIATLLDENTSILQRNISAAAAAEVFQLITSGAHADGKIDEAELATARNVLSVCIRRLSHIPEYAAFCPLADRASTRKVLEIYRNTSDIRGATGETVFYRLALLAAVIAQRTDILDSYFAAATVVGKLIVASGGVTREEQLFLNGLYSKQIDAHRRVAKFASQSIPTSPTATGTSTNPDLEKNDNAPDTALKEALAELNSLIGISSVKAEVNKLSNFLKIQQQRIRAGMPAATQSLHFVFTGNPGTGKTTVARIVGKILYGFQLLKTSNLVEADRSALVAGYLGQTAIKTTQIIDKANNGVLFIDEAYTLSPKSQDGDQYGQEAIDTLLKKMEDLRSTLVVIVAGYPDRMTTFLAANPGLESRFTRFIRFDDYHVSELCQIFDGMCQRMSYSLTPQARANLAILFNHAYAARDDKFGNARFVRNVFERAVGNNSDRLAAMDGVISKQMLSTIEAADIPLEMSGLQSNAFDVAKTSWRSKCPECDRQFVMDLRFLGNRASCKCGCRFKVPWWNLVRESLPECPTFTEYDRPVDLLGEKIQSQS